jgi:hypothetical protein
MQKSMAAQKLKSTLQKPPVVRIIPSYVNFIEATVPDFVRFTTSAILAASQLRRGAAAGMPLDNRSLQSADTQHNLRNEKGAVARPFPSGRPEFDAT